MSETKVIAILSEDDVAAFQLLGRSVKVIGTAIDGAPVPRMTTKRVETAQRARRHYHGRAGLIYQLDKSVKHNETGHIITGIISFMESINAPMSRDKITEAVRLRLNGTINPASVSPALSKLIRLGILSEVKQGI